MPAGWKKRASAAAPSAKPLTPAAPAMVVALPAASMRATRWSPSVANRSAPLTATPTGVSGKVARVVTLKSASAMARMLELPLSTTKRVPAPSTAIIFGLLKRAAAPMPSVVPATPALPATVVTAPVASTMRRIVLLSVSATKRLPLPSEIIPSGSRKRALAASPSTASPVPSAPANVVTAPVDGSTARTAWFSVSQT
jgi:hypothetical protein